MYRKSGTQRKNGKIRKTWTLKNTGIEDMTKEDTEQAEAQLQEQEKVNTDDQNYTSTNTHIMTPSTRNQQSPNNKNTVTMRIV